MKIEFLNDFSRTKWYSRQGSRKCLSFGTKGPLKMSIINLFLSPVNTSFNTYKMLMILHSTAQFLLCTKYTEHDSASVHTILIINS